LGGCGLVGSNLRLASHFLIRRLRKLHYTSDQKPARRKQEIKNENKKRRKKKEREKKRKKKKEKKRKEKEEKEKKRKGTGVLTEHTNETRCIFLELITIQLIHCRHRTLQLLKSHKAYQLRTNNNQRETFPLNTTPSQPNQSRAYLSVD
jgi:hypothetical protein